MKKVLVTGAAGFIGSFVAKKLCDMNINVVGVDNMNDYYDVRLKELRIQSIRQNDLFNFEKIDIEDEKVLRNVFENNKFDAVINLAARAGVRASLKNPSAYIVTNVSGTLNLLELCKQYGVKKFILASTSSLYAGNKMPFTEDVCTSTPLSPYAVSKGAAESLTYSYHNLYDIDVSVLRYFTVYGPASRPDMAVFRFIKWLMDGNSLELNGDGSQSRDFTYIDDIVNGTIKALKNVGYEVINLGSDSPHSINEIISILEDLMDRKANIINKPFPKEDAKATWASIDKAKDMLGWKPTVSIKDGLKSCVEWAKTNKDFIADMKV